MKLAKIIIFFFIVRTGFSVFENQRQEILIHDFDAAKVLSVKKGSRAVFWVAENSDKKKLVSFVTAPYCSSRRVRKVEIKTFSETVQKAVYNGKIYDLK